MARAVPLILAEAAGFEPAKESAAGDLDSRVEERQQRWVALVQAAVGFVYPRNTHV